MISYFEKQMEELNYSIHSLNENDFNCLLNESVNTLKNGNKIIVSGLGKNVPICEKFVGSMVSLGLDACFLNTNSAVHGDVGVVHSGDMVIVLTKSGETAESIYLTGVLKQRGVNIWLLTFNAESTLTKSIEKHLVLNLRHEGDMWNIMPNNSTTINLIILQGLAMMIAEKMDINIKQFKANHPGGNIGEILKSV